MRTARAAATLPLSAGAEEALDALARAPMADEAWLRAVTEFAAAHARAKSASGHGIVALLILQPR